MIPGWFYIVTLRIKSNTYPLRELEYDRAGMYVKETAKCLVFDGFKVRKDNIINIRRVE